MTFRFALALVTAAGCSTKASPPPPITPGSATPADATRAVVIPAETKQLVTAVIDSWDATTATLRLYTRTIGGWQPVGESWPAVIGSAGAAWGDGVHGDGGPADRGGPRKREGDRKSPAGMFRIRDSYGYAKTPPPHTAWPYTPVDDNWLCVDDPTSRVYASIVDRSKTAIDWHSAEQMKRPDELYTWVVDLAHNPVRTAGDGSCIFLHVWHGADSTTVGCTAMAEPQLASLISVLDPASHPIYVLLPRAEYVALAPAWGLPAL